MKNIYKLISEITDFCNGKDKIYIYGAGKYGIRCYRLLKYLNIRVESFVVTDKTTQKNDLPKSIEIPVMEHSELSAADNIGIIIAMTPKYYGEIAEKLSHEKIKYMLYFDAIPILEITTKIGCKVNCKYCPQKLLIDAYTAPKDDSPIYMEFESFKKYLENVPYITKIRFCGMCEPFLNKDCADMIEYAASKGYEVDVYSTLVGLSPADADRVLKNIDSIIVHIPDNEDNAYIPVTDEYIQTLKKVLEYKRNGKCIVPIISCHGSVNKEIEKYIPKDICVANELQDRAGNLADGEDILHWSKKGPIMCTCNDKNDNVLDCNILLPNGDVLLCCMDYALEYKLGNLQEKKYEDILMDNAINEIRKSMLYGTEDMICRRCGLARELLG